MKKQRIKRPMVEIPVSLQEAAEFIRRVGNEQREINGIRDGLNEKVEGLKAEAMAGVQSHEGIISQLMEGLFAFAQARRDELTEGGKRKSVELPTGSFGWRLTPPAVSLHDVKAVLNELKSRGLDRFVRTKEEVDKEAMLREHELASEVKGVSITQHEEFVVKPAEIDVEIISEARKLTKAAS